MNRYKLALQLEQKKCDVWYSEHFLNFVNIERDAEYFSTTFFFLALEHIKDHFKAGRPQ